MKVITIKDNKAQEKIPTLFNGDYGFQLVFNIKDDEYNQYNLNTSDVYLRFNNLLNNNILFNAKCVISDNTSGICNYTFATSDLQTSGVFVAALDISSPILNYSIELGRVFVK